MMHVIARIMLAQLFVTKTMCKKEIHSQMRKFKGSDIPKQKCVRGIDRSVHLYHCLQANAQ